MRTNQLGCLPITGIIAAFLMLLVITGVSLAFDGTLFSPGALNAQAGSLILGGVHSHGDIKACNTCHVPFWENQTMDERCVSCHQNILNDQKDFHQVMLAEGQQVSCRECHTDHKGKQAGLTIDDLKDFPHEKIGFALHAHLKMADGTPFRCSDCHGDTYLTFDKAICETCHNALDTVFIQDHLKTFSANCLSCHDGIDTLGKAFDHTKVAFTLTGKHTTVQCKDCHQKAQTLEDLKATVTDCTTCHLKDDPHGGRFGQECGSCHTPDGWKVNPKFDHSLANFKLTGKHIAVTCENCHVNGKYAGTPMDCASCHLKDDPHQGQLGQDCASCHTSEDWKATTFDHSRSSFQLVGKHSSVQCDQCHSDKIFKGTPQDCTSCHLKDDAHKGIYGTDCGQCHNPQDWKSVSFDHSMTKFPLIGKHAGIACMNCHTTSPASSTPTNCIACHRNDDKHAGQFGPDCATCHTPEDWKKITFDHSRAAFPLTGAHNQVSCLSCHSGGRFKGTPTNCFACHQKDDKHNGQFGTDCASCHSTSSWKNVTFDHSKTAFQLTGKHAGVNCLSCHAGGKFKGTPTVCYSCHKKDDRHAGQLGTDCKTCHSTLGWNQVTFDHSTAAFQLTGAHSQVSCQSCHAGGKFKGTPTACYACHKANDKHNGQFGTECGTCHSTQSWKGATFDHSRTAFPLTGSHVGLACQSCHSNGVFKGTPKDCYSCHAKDDNHAGQFGTDCGTCHSTQSWQGATFDHSRASFKLTGAHVNVACTQCHSGGNFKGTPSACSACHAEPDFHKGVLGTDCAACHNTSRWSPATYNGPHTFPMNHGNPASCRTCHPSTLGSWTCYSCHDQGEITKKHQEEGISDFSNCLQCHPTGRKEGGD